MALQGRRTLFWAPEQSLTALIVGDKVAETTPPECVLTRLDRTWVGVRRPDLEVVREPSADLSTPLPPRGGSGPALHPGLRIHRSQVFAYCAFCDVETTSNLLAG